MDTVFQKFYSDGKHFNKSVGQFGAYPKTFNTAMTFATQFRTTSALRHPNTNKLNDAPPIDNKNQNNNNIPQENISNPFQKTIDKLKFISVNDILNPTAESIIKTQNQNLPSWEDNKFEIKKNNTKVQIMEEKMKNLELKAQRLEVINDFFFDMFENNLIKDQLNKQREQNLLKNKQNKKEDELQQPITEEKEYIDNEMTQESLSKRSKKRKIREGKSAKSISSRYSNSISFPPDFDPKAFEDKTKKNATKVLNTIKQSVAEYVLEEQLKKNEEIQSMTEEILEIKQEMLSRLKRIQNKQKVQMESLAYALQNSGNPNIEEMAYRVFDKPFYDHKNITANELSPMHPVENNNNNNYNYNYNSPPTMNNNQRLASRASTIKTSHLQDPVPQNDIIEEEENKEEESSSKSKSHKSRHSSKSKSLSKKSDSEEN